MTVAADLAKEAVEEAALTQENVKAFTEGKTIRKLSIKVSLEHCC